MYDEIIDKNNPNSALKVKEGVLKPDVVNKDYLLHIKKRKQLSVEEYVKGILEGNRTILSQAITLVESSLFEHQRIAQQVIEKCLPYSGKSIRVGITGVPGVGKSSVIEVLGKQLTAEKHKVAVLAIDPSSERSKGSILGDKTRMESLASDENAFIRPSPSAGSLGGVARKTREIIILCEAAGFDVVIIETVGVGQSEVVAHSMVDFFLLLQLANAGDELQGIKRGIMEMADAIAINKAEGKEKEKSLMAANNYRNALHLFPMMESNWSPIVFTCSSYSKEGIDTIWKTVLDYVTLTKKNGYFYKKRNQQNLRILNETINSFLTESFYDSKIVKDNIEQAKEDILENKVSAYVVAQNLIDKYFNSLK
ncbi:MAG: methylmalonyl Co-A mutase-associated GTPase MeaB [Bacteroidales bacterium]|jgi:LAO/AO transport system kinase|nr:methylmalonyl Co-A mutase-associated GTPase MeaB [Bacteroidales bacterium]